MMLPPRLGEVDIICGIAQQSRQRSIGLVTQMHSKYFLHDEYGPTGA